MFCAPSCQHLTPLSEPQVHDPAIIGLYNAWSPSACETGLGPPQTRWALRPLRQYSFCHLGLPLPMEIKDHARSEWRHPERSQVLSQIALHPQHRFSHCRLVLPLALDPCHTQGGVYRINDADRSIAWPSSGPRYRPLSQPCSIQWVRPTLYVAVHCFHPISISGPKAPSGHPQGFGSRL